MNSGKSLGDFKDTETLTKMIEKAFEEKCKTCNGTLYGDVLNCNGKRRMKDWKMQCSPNLSFASHGFCRSTTYRDVPYQRNYLNGKSSEE